MRILSLAVMSVLGPVMAGCAPEFIRETPELVGRLMRANAPVSGAAVSIVRLAPSDDSEAASCRTALATTKTDSAGKFRAAAHRALVTESALKAGGAQGEFAICVGETDDSSGIVFRAPLARWDTLHVNCDLARTWLQANAQGMQGLCVATQAATDSQQLARPFSTVPPTACDTTATLITDIGIGPLKLNGSVVELRRVCPNVRDTIVQREGLFGPETHRASVLNVAGAPVLIRRVSGVIGFLEVASPVFRTRDSIRVGAPVTRLLRRPGLHVITIAPQEEPYVFAWYGNACGIGYSFTRRTYDVRENKGTTVPLARLRAWQPPASVRRMIIGFCPDRLPR